MKLKRIGREAITLAAVAALSSSITYWICSGNNAAELQDLKDKIAELEEKERSAIVTKRISEQMEDIAFQQKLMSDKQRARAEEQSRIADMERGKAQMEQRAARQAERKAVRLAYQADSMRIVAERQSELATHHMLEAQASRAEADTLFYKSLGRSLAYSAQSQSNAGNRPLAALLSYSAWYYTKEYKGNQYQQDIFTALVDAAEADKEITDIVKGDFRSMTLLMDGKHSKAIVAVSDYGEIVSIPTATATPWNRGIVSQPERLFENSAYDFRDVIIDDNGKGVALDLGGALAVLDMEGEKKCYMSTILLPIDKWTKLLRQKDDGYIAVGRHNVAWISSDLGALFTMETEKTICTAGMRPDGTLVLVTDNGEMTLLDNSRNATTVPLPWGTADKATAYAFYPNDKCDVFGMESGAIYVCKEDGTHVTTLLGHTGRISHLENFSRMIMSSSYDSSVRMWDLGNINKMVVSNEIKYDRWPMCFLFDRTTAMLQIGLEGGQLHSLCISAKANADNLQKHIQREFTPEEWDYYIGPAIPYKTFMP